ncbi:MAG: hypothetical protein ACREQX_01360 [Candidatus Binataceae bacterium]
METNLIEAAVKWDNSQMALEQVNFASFLKLAENLRELEITVGERARPAVASVRARLLEASTKRRGGDYPGALALLRDAMDRLAALGTELDPGEGALMALIAERFTKALNLGDKDAAKQVLKVMRHRAGDPKDEDDGGW